MRRTISSRSLRGRTIIVIIITNALCCHHYLTLINGFSLLPYHQTRSQQQQQQQQQQPLLLLRRIKSPPYHPNTNYHTLISSATPDERILLLPSTTLLKSSSSSLEPSRQHDDISPSSSSTPRIEPIFPHLGTLFRHTRPSNFPGVLFFHILGTYLSLRTHYDINYTPSLLISNLRHPSSLLTLLALLLTSATSMLINDYYDGRSGVDTSTPFSDDNNITTINGTTEAAASSLRPTTKRFLSILYTMLLITITVLPGVGCRLSVVVGALLTFWYTPHLKPRMGVKNVVCALLIALSPLTSGLAAVSVAAAAVDGAAGLGGGALSSSLLLSCVRSMSRLMGVIFCGIMSREIFMDVLDVETDRGLLETIPVRYGKNVATRVSFGFLLLMTVLAFGGRQQWGMMMMGSSMGRSNYRKLAMSVLGCGWMLARGWKVVRDGGSNDEDLSKAIEDGKLSMFLILGGLV